MVLVDLGGCTSIGPAGLSVLVGLARRLQRLAGRSLVLLPGPADVQRTIALAGLSAVLPFAPAGFAPEPPGP